MFFCYYMEWTPLSEIVRILYNKFLQRDRTIICWFYFEKKIEEIGTWV